MAIVSFHDVLVVFANVPILDHVDWHLQPQEKIALVGRNGAGKSTLLKLLGGELVHDGGHIHQQQGLRVAGLAQDVPVACDACVYDVMVKPLGALGEALIAHRRSLLTDAELPVSYHLDDHQGWDFIPRIDAMAVHLGLDLDAHMSTLSGGMKRRVLLAAALLAEPDLLLLDEPTNHLDLQSIEWLEGYLKTYPGTVLLVTHDRSFLNNVAEKIIEIDRGQLFTYACDYATFIERREARLLNETKHENLFDKRLREEEVWLRTGIKARRTRNEGRVRALKALRETYQQRRAQQGRAQSVQVDVSRSGQLVLEAQQVNYAIGDRDIIRDFSSLVMRGDKIGIMGPNGCGKTTLVQLLLNTLVPDSGTIRQGTGLSIAYFDQLRRQLEDDKTVMENVADGADYVTIAGEKKHVASYLQEFLFTPCRFNQKVSELSGGERHRLLLAKLFAKPVNLVIMDEPTNDLDLETLDLLEALLVEYKGTFLVISHDRAFINNVVTRVWMYEPDGRFHDYVGGYDENKAPEPTVMPVKTVVTQAPQPSRAKLDFAQQRELAKLPQQIESIEKKMAVLHQRMAEPGFYQKPPEAIRVMTDQLKTQEDAVAALYQRWDELESAS